jgi:uncharacterized protein (DUF4415 family)
MAKIVGLRSGSTKSRKSLSSNAKKAKPAGASSRRVKPIIVSVNDTGGRSKGKTDWERLRNMTDEDIEKAVAEDPDAAPILDENFWKNAVVVSPGTKIATSVRLDRDVLTWFRAKGKGYQTRINAVLRSYMQAHRR